jgi:glucosamine-6-phosphate deaminase
MDGQDGAAARHGRPTLGTGLGRCASSRGVTRLCTLQAERPEPVGWSPSRGRIPASVNLYLVDSLAAPVSSYWRDLQARTAPGRRFAVASPLSSTPLPVYALLVAWATTSEGWRDLDFVLMDEQVDGARPPFSYVAPDDPASYEGFARRHLLGPLEAKLGIAIPVAKPSLEHIETFAKDIDLLILALGTEGNYANVMPGTPLDVGWHIARLTPEFRQVHTQPGSQSYSGATFREFGMSLGPQQVLAAGAVLVMISGRQKQRLARQLLSYDRFDPNFPLSIIHHDDVQARVSLFITEDVDIDCRSLIHGR